MPGAGIGQGKVPIPGHWMAPGAIRPDWGITGAPGSLGERGWELTSEGGMVSLSSEWQLRAEVLMSVLHFSV